MPETPGTLMGWRLRAAIRHAWEAVVRVSMTKAETGSRPDGLGRRVVLLAESAGLTLVLGQLLDPGDRLSRLDSLRDLADRRALEGADLVVLDLPDEYRAVAVRHVRRRYKGPLAVLAGEAEDPDTSGLDDACTLLHRPFSIDQLRAALATGAAGGREPARAARPRPRPASAPAAALAQALMAGVAAVLARIAEGRRATLGRQAAGGRPDRIERAQRLLVAFVEGWRARRQIRVAGFWILALLAFGVAFAVAQRGCGPTCDALGTGISPAPTITAAGGRSPAATSPKHAPRPTRTAAVAPQGTGAYQGISRSNPAITTTTWRPATTTTRRPGSGGGTPPRPTEPPTTPTTGPPPTTPTTEPPTTPTTEPPTTVIEPSVAP
jgi:hypothetical protein